MLEAAQTSLKPTKVAAAVSISVPYASQILAGRRQPSTGVAVRIFREFGVKLGPIANASESDIAALERIEAARA